MPEQRRALGPYDRFFPYRAGARIHVGLCASDEGGALVTACSSAHPDSRIARLQSDGSLLWSATRVEGHVRAAAAIDEDGDGVHADGFVLAGVDDPFGDEDGFLTRLDSVGNPLWSITDGAVEGFDCVGQGEFIDSDGLEMPAVAAAGTRADDGTSGLRRVGRVRFQSLDGSHEDAVDPYLVESAPAVRYGVDRWEVLGIAGAEAFVNEVAQDLDFLGARFLERLPDAQTVELLGDGSVLDLDSRSPTPTAAEIVLTRQGPDGRVALERVFPLDGRFVERAHDVTELAGGGYAVLGESTSFGSGSEQVWLLLLDEDGELLRQRFFERVALLDSGETLDVLSATRDGGLAFAAWVDGHLRLVRLDGAGEELWNSEPLSPEESVDSRLFVREGLAALIETEDGGFALCGPTEAPGAWVARLDAQGAALWRRAFEPVNGRALEATTILETPAGLALAGTHAGELWLMELDGAGSVQRSSFYPLGGSAAGPSCRLARGADGTLLLAASWIDVEEPGGSIEDGAESTRSTSCSSPWTSSARRSGIASTAGSTTRSWPVWKPCRRAAGWSQAARIRWATAARPGCCASTSRAWGAGASRATRPASTAARRARRASAPGRGSRSRPSSRTGSSRTGRAPTRTPASRVAP